MPRSTEEELNRMREVNLTLRRQLERARRDALLYAASVCEDHFVTQVKPSVWSIEELYGASGRTHHGSVYAEKLREIAK